MEKRTINNRDFIYLGGRRRIPTEVLALDTENANSDIDIANGITFLWAIQMGGIHETLESESWLYSNWDEVFNNLKLRLQKIRDKQNHHWIYPNILIYVHNLSHDWSHMRQYVCEHFKWTEFIDEKKRKEISDDNYFTMLSTKTESSVYSIKFRILGCPGIVEIRDSSKILTGSLSKLAKSYNTATKKLEEPEEFYKKVRTLPYTLTDEEKLYCYQDIRVVLECVYKHIERDDLPFFKSLSAASYSKYTMFDEIYPHKDKKGSQQQYRKTYPRLKDVENSFISKAYQGGLAMTMPKYNGKELNCVVDHYDAHQHYPSCATAFLYPYGKGKFKKGLPDFSNGKFKIMKLSVKFDKTIFPLDIRLLSILYFNGTKNWIEVYWPSTYFMFDDRKNIDTEFSAYDCYKNLDIDWFGCEYYEYNVKELDYAEFFKNNWDKRMKAKSEGDDFGTTIYKLFNNSLYGKTAEKKKHYKLTMDKDDVNETYILTETNDGKDGMNASITYFPVAVAITSYARCRLGAFGKCIGFNNLVKTDTDSLFFIRNNRSLRGLKKINLKNELNGWGNENTKDGDCIAFASIGGKRYKELFENGIIGFTCCGVSKSEILKVLQNEKYKDNKENRIKIFNGINIISGTFKAVTFKRDFKTKAKMIASMDRCLACDPEELYFNFKPKKIDVFKLYTKLTTEISVPSEQLIRE